MSTKEIQERRNIGLLCVHNVEPLNTQGYDIMYTFPGQNDSIFVMTKIPTSISRNDLEKDSNILSYQLHAHRH